MSAFGCTPAWGPVLKAAKAGDLPLLRIGANADSVAREAYGLVYLATPYSKIAVGPDGAWDVDRSVFAMAEARTHAIRLARRGVTAISPIMQAASMCHATDRIDPLDEAFWTRWCKSLLAAARSVVVPDIRGWDQSSGVWHEVRTAIAANRVVHVYAEAV
ncbi:DUF1937 family protein [Defluviimonas sp. SAOS-178_SWC]|uniref:DUF1937 family protein n=1 Tax=Defluviimonas sp. SAOS-178_SWC TaxID=3121287 RepID=UPI00322216F5